MEKFTKDMLLHFVRKSGVKGYSKLNKPDLIKFMEENNINIDEEIEKVPISTKSEFVEFRNFVLESGAYYNFRKSMSPNGFTIDILKSGMQKYIRRGIFDKALYCSVELDSFKYVENGMRVSTNMIHRLQIIFLEDIGPCGISFFVRFNELIEDMINNIESNSLPEIIFMLCNSLHTRESSHINAVSRINSIFKEFSKTDKKVRLVGIKLSNLEKNIK